MKIIIASQNPAKIAAAQQALDRLFPAVSTSITGVAVPSGVSAQPFSDEETRLGACNRARAAQQACPDADLWIGMEGGVARLHRQLQTFAWIQVLGQGLDNGARSASLTLPSFVADALEQGEELGDAMDRLFRLTNCKQAGGAIGVLTQNALSRTQVYRDTLILALAPLLNPAPYAVPARQTNPGPGNPA
ncbi:inosine/xanthosine triphosphatase [Zobellella maritima]|uniref:inosine/xanthosine triphosphatase n=1 Tax=Zobellella maritima TaxID=2059725 RepID=UPI000E306CF6|nr:inosine/xanthosine triphosphatase [Zobellella maritima]